MVEDSMLVNDAEFSQLGRTVIRVFRAEAAQLTAPRWVRVMGFDSRRERRKRESIARTIGAKVARLAAQRRELVKALAKMRKESDTISPQEAEAVLNIDGLDRELRVARRNARK